MQHASTRSAIAALALAVGAANTHAQTVRFTVKDLGTLGGELANAFEINNNGEITGQADEGVFGATNAFLYRDGQMINLGSLNSFNTGSNGIDINELGHVVGSALAPDPVFIGSLASRPFFWSPETGMIDITPDPTESGLGLASAVNDHGVVAGFWRNITFRWTIDGGMVQLPSLPGAFDTAGDPWSINNEGTIVGRAFNPAGRVVPVIWPADGGILELPAFGPNPNGWARDINEADQIVGEVTNTLGRTEPVLWENGVATLLGFIPEPFLDWGTAEGINNLGEIVGWDASAGASGIPAAGWYRGLDGFKLKLNDLIIDPDGIWDIRIPLAINDAGQIVGIAVKIGDDGFPIPGVAFLLTPVVSTPCIGDINSDGEINGSDLLLLLNDWGADRSNADLNSDGAVDGSDLLLMLNAWGPCPN